MWRCAHTYVFFSLSFLTEIFTLGCTVWSFFGRKPVSSHSSSHYYLANVYSEYIVCIGRWRNDVGYIFFVIVLAGEYFIVVADVFTASPMAHFPLCISMRVFFFLSSSQQHNIASWIYDSVQWLCIYLLLRSVIYTTDYWWEKNRIWKQKKIK